MNIMFQPATKLQLKLVLHLESEWESQLELELESAKAAPAFWSYVMLGQAIYSLKSVA